LNKSTEKYLGASLISQFWPANSASSRASLRLLAAALLSLLLLAGATMPASADHGPVKVAVLDAVLIYVTIPQPLTDGEIARLEKYTNSLRNYFDEHEGYELVEHTGLDELVKKHVQGVRIERCDRCNANIARDLGADRIFLPWIYKTSELILQMNLDMRDDDTGRLTMREVVHMRGNADQTWDRGFLTMSRKLDEL